MKKSLFFSLFFLFALPLAAQATLFNFHLIGDDNSPSNDLGSQLQLDVTDGIGVVDFTFMNIGDISSFISDVYFDVTPNDFLDFGSVVLSYTGDVLFSEGAAPGDLPGGETIGFVSDWDADADSPSPEWGVNNYIIGDAGTPESLKISFDYFTGQDFDTVIEQINSGALSIGLHVQGIDPFDESEAYVNNTTPVPEPATMLLFTVGLAGVAATGIKKKKA